MIDKIFATNGVGFCFIMTAMGNHLTYEAIRERRAAVCAYNMAKSKNKATAEKRKLSFAVPMILRQEYEKP